MRRILWVVLFWTLLASAQVVGPGFVDYVTSAPSGACSQGAHQQNVLGSGAVYSCQSGTWATVGGGGGTVTSVTGTTNQINVATGTTTPVISLSSTLVIPGTITATAYATSGSNGGITGIEGTGAALTPAAGTDLLYPDSTNHCWHQSLNAVDVGCLPGKATSGYWIPSGLGSISTGTASLVAVTNEMDCIRFNALQNLTSIHFSYMPTVSAGASSHVGFAIYDTTGATRLMTTGALDGTLVGKQTVTVSSFTLIGGTPYLYCWTDDAASPGTWSAYALTTTAAQLGNIYNTTITSNFVKGGTASVAGAPPTSVGTLTAISNAALPPIGFVEP